MKNIIQYEHAQPFIIQGDGGGRVVTKEVYTSEQYKVLAEKIIDMIKDQGYTSIIAVARGGLPILALIEQYGKSKLPKNIRFGVLHAASYTGIGTQKEVHIADAISFLDGGSAGDNPLMLDDMFDSAKSAIAINKDLTANKGFTHTPPWAVLLEKEHAEIPATHAAQYTSNNWVVQSAENYTSSYAGENVARILTTPRQIIQPGNDYDNLQRFAEWLSVKIYQKGINPSAIIAVGDIRTAHVAGIISRILDVPSGTQLTHGQLSFVNPMPNQKRELGDKPLKVSLPRGSSDMAIGTQILTGADSEGLFGRYTR